MKTKPLAGIFLCIKTKHLAKILLCMMALIFFTGCSAASTENSIKQAEPDGTVTVGKRLRIENENEALILSDNNDALAADGLYYATWVMGTPTEYENEDGETVDLYDAQLYLLMGESGKPEDAESNLTSWLAAAKTNYEISEEKELSCNGISYTVMEYGCKETSPYERGVSAFGLYEDCAVCIEFTCTEAFEDDIESILIDFLNGCYFS